jgi:hypothetical protein
MLLQFLRHVRSRPKAVRDQYALFCAGVFTAVIAALWLFNSSYLGGGTAAHDTAVPSNPPFSSVVNQMKDQWAAVQEAFTAPATSTVSIPPETTVPEVVDPRELILTEETKSNAALPASPVLIATTSASQTLQYQEVQITTKAHASTTPSLRE